MIPGGSESVGRVPVGHGSNKFKREALDEVVLRVIDAIRRCAMHAILVIHPTPQPGSQTYRQKWRG